MKYPSVSLFTIPAATASPTTFHPSISSTRHGQQLSVALLVASREQRQHQMGHRGELRMALIVRIAEVLDLRHRKLADSQQTCTRRDLVAEPRPHLRRSERELVSVEVQQAAEVHEHALGGFGTEEALHRAFRTDLRAEHQIEREGVGQRVPRRQSHHAVLREQSVQLVRRVGICLDANVLQLQTLLARQGQVLQQLVHLCLQQLLHIRNIEKPHVCAVALARLAVLHHQIGELVDVACKLDR